MDKSIDSTFSSLSALVKSEKIPGLSFFKRHRYGAAKQWNCLILEQLSFINRKVPNKWWCYWDTQIIT